MIIKKLTIVNFQSYKGENELEFAPGLNLILGRGGKGKSKLFNAFYWVLFGRIYITDLGWCTTNSLPESASFKLQRHEFINANALYDCNEGQSVCCSVCLELKDDKEKEYRIERIVRATRSTNTAQQIVWTVENAGLRVEWGEAVGTKSVVADAAEDKIKEIFPEGIRKYIWFQGEALDQLINFQDKKTLESAVKHISYYPYFEKMTALIKCACEDIERRETKALRTQNRENKKQENLLTSKESKIQEITGLENKLYTLKEQQAASKILLENCDKELQKLNEYQKLQQEIETLNREEQLLVEKMDRIDQEERSKVASLWILRNTAPLIEEGKVRIQAYETAAPVATHQKHLDTPSRAKLEEILSTGQCFVCGSAVDEATHAEAHKWLLQRLADQAILQEVEADENVYNAARAFDRLVGKIEDYPDKLLAKLPNIDLQYKKLEENIEKLQKERERIRRQKQSKEEEQEKLRNKYGLNTTMLRKTEIQSTDIKGTKQEFEKLSKQIGACEEQLNTKKEELKGIEQEIANMQQRGEIQEVPETRWLQISRFLGKVCQNVQQNARQDLLRKIEERANRYYKQFTEHDPGYTGSIEIDEQYKIRYEGNLNTSHTDRKKISIINALLSLNQEALGVWYPFISDAPTSSFDANTTHRYLMGLKDIFGQSIVMTKDIETGSEHYDVLFREAKVSRIYQLSSDISEGAGESPEIHKVNSKIECLKR